MKNLIALLLIGLVIMMMSSCTATKLHNGWYTYNQVKKAGYDCKPFKERQYIRATSDSSKVNITVKN